MEGVGQEVIVVFSTLIIAVILIALFCRRRTSEDPEETNDVDRPPVYNNNLCPICWSEQSFGIETNCGHLYCGQCFRTYYNRNNLGSSGVTCPMCRQRVGLLFLCFTNAERTSDLIDLRTEITSFVRRYNRVISNNLTIWERICEMPILLRHFLIHLVDGNEFGPNYIRVRLIIFISLTVLYILIPYDIFPEFVYGIYGYIEDIIAFFILAFYLSRFYRNFIAQD